MRRAARRHLLDVCEQIVYQLVVFKAPLREQDLEQVGPPYRSARMEAFLRARRQAPKPRQPRVTHTTDRGKA